MIVKKDEFLDVLARNPGNTAKELVKPCRNKFGTQTITRTDINQTLYSLLKEGKVIQHADPQGGAPDWAMVPVEVLQPA